MLKTIATLIDSARYDLRSGLRQARRRPAVLFGAMCTLAFGLAAVTILFTLVDHALLRPVGLEGFERVVQLGTRAPGGGGRSPVVAPVEYAAWRRQPGVLEELAPLLPTGGVVQVDGLPRRVSLIQAGERFFETLALPLAKGRTFDPLAPDDQKTAVLSHSFWSGQLGGDPAVVGRPLVVDGEPLQVVGVLGPELGSVFEDADVLVPLVLSAAQLDDVASYLFVVGRMAPGVSVREAVAGLEPAQTGLNDLRAEEDRTTVDAVRLRAALVGPLGPRLALMMVAAAAVLLIACSNVSHLLLARGVSRRRELQTRAALGATTGRVTRQLLVETGVLAAGAITLSLGITWVGLDRSRVFLQRLGANLEQAQIDPRVVGFSCALGLLSLFLAGLWPARRAAVHASPARSRELGPERSLWNNGLVALQGAVTVLLLGVAGLMVRSAILEARVDVGFSSSNRLSAMLSLPFSSYSGSEAVSSAYDQVLERVRSLPDVEHAGVSNRIPLAGPTLGIDWAATGREREALQAGLRIASPGYARAAGLTVLRGRWISAEDRADATAAVVLTRGLAESLFGSIDAALGANVSPLNAAFQDEDGVARRLTVVGVIEDVRTAGPRAAARPAAVVPLAQAPAGPLGWIGNTLSFVVSSPRDPESLARDLRSVVGQFDEQLALFNVETLDRRLRLASEAARVNTLLFSLLGLVALLLAASGIYGLTAMQVAQRRAEFGVRLALGASFWRLVGDIVRRVAAPIVLGLVFGLLALAAGGRWLGSELFGVASTDLSAGSAAVLLLLLATGLAAFLPARRAAGADPLESLNAE